MKVQISQGLGPSFQIELLKTGRAARSGLAPACQLRGPRSRPACAQARESSTLTFQRWSENPAKDRGAYNSFFICFFLLLLLRLESLRADLSCRLLLSHVWSSKWRQTCGRFPKFHRVFWAETLAHWNPTSCQQVIHNWFVRIWDSQIEIRRLKLWKPTVYHSLFMHIVIYRWLEQNDDIHVIDYYSYNVTIYY